MKIEIEYNPILPYTTLTVEHEIRDTIFGELFPVCEYPIQSWLKKRGSWNGLLKVLKDISRQRSIELIFTGRTVDFDDVKEVITDGDIRLTHIAKYENTLILTEDITCLKQIMREYPDCQVYEKFMSDLTIDVITPTLYIESMEDFWKNEGIIRTTSQVIVVPENMIKCLQEVLDKIQFENFNRPDDSIVYMVDSRQSFYKVTDELKRQYTVCIHGSDKLPKIEEKYNLPISCRSGLEIHRIAEKWIEDLLAVKKYLVSRNAKIKEAVSTSESDALEHEYDYNCSLLKWFRNNEEILLMYREKFSK